MIPTSHLAVGLCTALLWVGAQAQVTRCTDARTGKVSYTDGVCNSGEAASELEIHPPPEEVRRYQQLSADVLARGRQGLWTENGAMQADAPMSRDYARSSGCLRSQGAYDLMQKQGRYRLSQEHGRLMETARRNRDIDCLGPEVYAERERQQERDRREQEYREAALRRETALRDQMERDHRYHQERERDRERQRDREREEARRDKEQRDLVRNQELAQREQAQREQADRERRDREREHTRREQEREQARRDQMERERREAADQTRNQSRPVQAGLSSTSTGWRGNLRPNP